MVTDDDNATIERMVTEGKSAMAIRAAVPNVSRTNVYLKITKFKKHGTVGRVQTKTLGRPRAMTEGVDKFLQGLLAAKPDMELDEMRRHLQKELDLTVSMSTISRAIARAGIATGQRPVRSRSTAAASTTPRRPNAKKVQQHSPSQQQPPLPQPPSPPVAHPPLSHHMPHEPPIESHLVDLPPTNAHLLDPWQDMTAPPHHHLNGHHQPQLDPHHLHALDPSLASAYHTAVVYQDLYPDSPHNLTVGPSLDVYRSPYAPM